MRISHSDYSGEGVSVSYELNAGYVPKYAEDFVDRHQITKEQLNVYLGIELFYGNYKEYLPRYLVKHSELIRKLVTLKNKVDYLPTAIEKAIIKHGIQAIESVEQEYKIYNDEYQEIKKEVIAELPDLATEIGIPEEELLEVLTPWLGKDAALEAQKI